MPSWRWGRRILRVEFAIVVAFLYLPIAVVVGLSFNESGQPTAWTGFSLDWYGSVLANEALLQAFRNTLVVGVVTTVIASLIGTLLAMGLERTVHSSLLDSLVFVPMVVPDIVLAIALLSFYNLVFAGLLQLELGLWTVILSHVVFDIAFVAIVVPWKTASISPGAMPACSQSSAMPVTMARPGSSGVERTLWTWVAPDSVS